MNGERRIGEEPTARVGSIAPAALRPADAAAFLGLSESTFRKLVDARRTPRIKIGHGRGGAVLFRVTDLEQLLEELLQEQAP